MKLVDCFFSGHLIKSFWPLDLVDEISYYLLDFNELKDIIVRHNGRGGGWLDLLIWVI